MTGLAAWIRDVHRRGLCEHCKAPIEWTRQPLTTCPGKCQRARTRIRAEPPQVARWIYENKIHSLIYQLKRIEYDDIERQERHTKYLSMLDGSYKPPPRSRLGHAAPRYKPTDDPEGSMVFGTPESMRRHESFALLPNNAKDRAADKLAHKWLAEHEFSSV